MRKFILLAVLFATTVAGYAQTVDVFNVGPYKVFYKGEGDYEYRFRDGINLYEFFELKPDTVVLDLPKKTRPVEQAWQLNAFAGMPRFSMAGNCNLFGVGGNYKMKVGEYVYLNGGLSVALSYGKYYFSDNKPVVCEEVMMEIGAPLSVEFASLDYDEASLYAAVGLTPAYFGALKSDVTRRGRKYSQEVYGFLFSPKVSLGGYIPLGEQLLQIGLWGEYKVDCSKGNVYEKRIGRVFVGANAGIVF